MRSLSWIRSFMRHTIIGPKKTNTSWLLSAFLILSLGMLVTCDDPGGLSAVSGVQGTVDFDPDWPDSLKGAAVVVFDLDLDLDSISTPGYSVVDHFITFSSPIDPGITSAEYFIQLQPDGYMIMVIGLLAEPAQLLTNAEMFLNIQDFIVVPENSIPRGIIIREMQINEQTAWYIQF